MTTAPTLGLAGPNAGQAVAVTVLSVYSLTVFIGDPHTTGFELTAQPEGAPTLRLP